MDYCGYVHEHEELPLADVVSNAILAHFQLTLQAECNLLQSDLAWWEHKMVYRPHLAEDLNVKEVIMGLRTRLDSMRSQGLGQTSEEFRA